MRRAMGETVRRAWSGRRFAAAALVGGAAFTRELPGWELTGPTLLEDLDRDHYYRRV